MRPTGNVTIGLSSSSPTDSAPTVSSLTFTPANALTPQTVYVAGAHDQVDDGDVYFNVITAAAVSTDPAYSGLNAADVQVLNIDSDTAGILVTPTSGLTTTEAGGTATFTVQLLTIPTATVTIGLSSSNTAEGTVTPTLLTFPTNATALTAQTVTIHGVNDSVIDGNIAYSIVTGAATSSDPKYSGMAVPDVSVTNLDDDFAGFVVTPTSGLTTTEAGGTAQFTIRLTARPTTNVTISLSSSNVAEGTVSPASVTFTPANALTNQTVTVTGVDDTVVDGNIAYSVVTGAAVSGDLNFNGLNPPDVAVTNTDNDPIKISSIVVNGGAAQRSMVKGLTVTFDRVLNIGANAFTVVRTDGYTAGLIITPTVTNGRSVVTLTFTGAGIVAGSLPDGRFTLTVTGAGITDSLGQQLDGNNDGTPGGDYVSPPDTMAGGPGQLRLFRLFGDTNGDGTVDQVDLGQFRVAFNTVAGNPGYLAYLDANGDGVIDQLDLGQFRVRFNLTVF